MKKNVMLTLTIILLSSQALAFEFCDDGTLGEDNIRLISIDDMLKENSREWVWQSLQKIEIETRVENKNDEDGTYVIEAIFKDKDNTIKIADDSDDLEIEFSLSANERKSISLEFETDEDLDVEKYDLYIKFYKKSQEDEECVENSEEKITIEKIEICEDEEVDEDELELTEIRDETEDNEDEWEWAPGNNIEVSLNLKNKDYSERDFIVELIFLDENNEEVFLADDSDDIIKETDLDEDEDDDLTFDFKLKSDIEEAKYTLYAKAYDSDDEDICTSLKAEDKSNSITIKIEKAERKVIMTKIEGPTETTTDSDIQYTATITNLGSKDEDKILAIIYNYQLGIKEKIEIEDLESGEDITTIFNIFIPKNASLSRHALIFSTEYEYNERQDYYRSSSDEDDDIKHYITISQGIKIEEPEIIENETTKRNETISIEIPKNETIDPEIIITGNVIGTSGKSSGWITLIVLILLIVGALFFKNTYTKKTKSIEPPRIAKRYTARLG